MKCDLSIKALALVFVLTLSSNAFAQSRLPKGSLVIAKPDTVGCVAVSDALTVVENEIDPATAFTAGIKEKIRLGQCRDLRPLTVVTQTSRAPGTNLVCVIPADSAPPCLWLLIQRIAEITD